MNTIYRYMVIGILMLTFFNVAAVQAAGIKERMTARLPEIVALKAQGAIGETNRGYLEFVGPKVKEDMVTMENSDRQQVYTAIAAQQGASIEVVEKIRAAQIADKGQPGEWFQDQSGKWYQK